MCKLGADFFLDYIHLNAKGISILMIEVRSKVIMHEFSTLFFLMPRKTVSFRRTIIIVNSVTDA